MREKIKPGYSKNMQFVRASATDGIDALVRHLTETLQKDKRVLWLLAGGSNIPLSVQAMEHIPEALTPKLTIMPADERYGLLGHPDSNVRQLYDAGFGPKYARFVPILGNEDFAITLRHFSDVAKQLFGAADSIIAQLGMGADGHVAGILPGSVAATNGTDLVAGYTGPDFQRLTLTFAALKQVRTAYLFAYGENKRGALEQLQNENPPYEQQPAQILKAIPSAYVYNDLLEGE